MSNALAIAATTSALRNLLHGQVPGLIGMGDIAVTTSPPDLAGKDVTGLTLNLFLYLVQHSAAWRNQDMPRQVRPGETGKPPLALDLHFLLTAYSGEEPDAALENQRALAAAMSVLHDHPLLGAQELRDALPESDVADQIERLRITPLQLSIDELSKLWSAFQSSYRTAASYVVSVVLIDSRRPVKAALPVLRRGKTDRGPFVDGALGAILGEAKPPLGQQAVRQGEAVVFTGEGLGTRDTVLRFSALGADGVKPIELAPQPGDADGTLMLTMPALAQDDDALVRWSPGFYAVSLLSRPDQRPAVNSNEVMLALAPSITVSPNSSGAPVPAGATITLTCRPRIRPGQRVMVLFGDSQLAPASLVNPDETDPDFKTRPTTITFAAPAAGKRNLVRLRVDGVDSIPVIGEGDPPLPTFDPLQQVAM
jgi:Pvc16 N-terminal domain